MRVCRRHASNFNVDGARYEVRREQLAPCDAGQVLPKIENWCKGVYPFRKTRLEECGAGAKYFVQQQMLYCNGACQLPVTSGPCHASASRWYFDPSIGACQQFSYGGCGGNDNNFGSKNECQAACLGGANTGCPDNGSCPTSCGGLTQGLVVGVVWALCPEDLSQGIDQPRPQVTITHECEMEMLRECYTSTRNSFASKKQAGLCLTHPNGGGITNADRNNIWHLCANEIAAMKSDAQIP